jgi:hypothetical protein
MESLKLIYRQLFVCWLFSKQVRLIGSGALKDAFDAQAWCAKAFNVAGNDGYDPTPDTTPKSSVGQDPMIIQRLQLLKDYADQAIVGLSALLAEWSAGDGIKLTARSKQRLFELSVEQALVKAQQYSWHLENLIEEMEKDFDLPG